MRNDLGIDSSNATLESPPESVRGGGWRQKGGSGRKWRQEGKRKKWVGIEIEKASSAWGKSMGRRNG